MDVSKFYPLVVGHEIIGEVIRAGPKAKPKVGDIVGVGPMCDSCLECEYCKKGACTTIDRRSHRLTFRREQLLHQGYRNLRWQIPTRRLGWSGLSRWLRQLLARPRHLCHSRP
jgi:threonine dehydrogenase-like Zn-dependent dehydrogenase